MSGICIPMGNSERVAVVSPEDYDHVSGFYWNMRESQPGYRVAQRTSLVQERNCEGAPRNITMGRQVAVYCGWLDGWRDPRSIDHIDGDPLNNQRDNIRVCTHTQNMGNRKKHRNYLYSAVPNVSYQPQTMRWQVRVRKTINGVQVYVGYETFEYDEYTDAVLYAEFLRKAIFGEFARPYLTPYQIEEMIHQLEGGDCCDNCGKAKVAM
jgi:hypothetical protein